MNWFTSLFSPPPSSNNRKGQTMHSTHEAFSLPTSSPIFSSHPDAFNPDTLNTPDPETALSPSYTYPPQGPASYGYLPTSNGSKSSSLLPLHHNSIHSPVVPNAPYPPLETTWNRLKNWLAREYPELGDTLNYGILPMDLANVEMQFGFALPAVVRESYLIVDGQEPESAAGCSEGLFFGLSLLPLENVLEEWRFWREVDDDPATGANARLREAMASIPPGWIRREYSQRGWIPLIADKAGNYIGVDMNPAENGAVGQVIVFGRDFDTKVVLFHGDGAAGWAKWLAAFVEDLETGDGFEVGNTSDDSEGSEDDIGYESYFYDGNGRATQGDGGGGGGTGGGLHLTGEYRGWNVLEAWADRSVRKWYETGVISEKLPEDESPKTERKGINALEISQESATEVIMPVIGSNGEVTPPASRTPNPSSPTSATPTLIDVSSKPRKAANLPSISVTKPPAPLPVELPTPRDIVALPSPPDSLHSSFDDDLEAGRRDGMRHLDQDPLTSSVHQPKPTVSQAVKPASPPTGDLISSSPPPRQHSSLVGRLSPPPEDLLSGAAPDITPALAIQPALIQTDDVESNDSSSQLPDPVDPDVTIRLVGGGGTSGVALTDGEVDDAGVEDDTASVASTVSQTSATNGKKSHKKTKSGASLAGLKKLGNLVRKDSASSTQKETTEVAAVPASG